MPVPEELIGLPQPRGAKGWKLAAWPLIMGRVMIKNRVVDVILMSTRTALNVAPSFVPMTSKVVTNPTTRTAGRLINPPTSPPWRKPHWIGGPTFKASGKWPPTESSRPLMNPDQPTATADAPSAYSRISAQPTSQATNSPITADGYERHV